MRALLTALLDDALRRLPEEPNLHDKRVLGHQARDHALSLQELGGREETEPPAAPDRDHLIARARERLRRLDPIGDEPEFAALTLLVRRLERHALESPPRLITFTPNTTPARDPFVELGTERPGPHADLNRALVVAEVAAITAADSPLETTLQLTELIAAELDETAAIEAALDHHWGSEPVDLSEYDRLLALPVADRVEELLRELPRGDEDPGV